jgi:hypothetical protein
MILLESRRRALKPGKHWLSAISYDGHMVIVTYHGVFFVPHVFFSPEGEEKRGEEIRDVIRLPCPGAQNFPMRTKEIDK